MWQRFTTDEVAQRLEDLDLPFNAFGYDRFGISKRHLGAFYSLLGHFHADYFSVKSYGIENIPDTGRAMVIGNHSGGLPVDAGMCMASVFFDHDPPRHLHGMVEKFANLLPFTSSWFSRLGQLTGLPEHAVRLLEDERLLMIFPEGARGTGKLYKDKYKLVRFGTGFMRIALQTGSPIVPFAFVGGEEAIPVIYHSTTLAKLFRAPYFPITPYGLPIPRRVQCTLHYAPPMRFEGTGRESDDVIEGYVEQVKDVIADLIEEGRRMRRGEEA